MPITVKEARKRVKAYINGQQAIYGIKVRKRDIAVETVIAMGGTTDIELSCRLLPAHSFRIREEDGTVIFSACYVQDGYEEPRG